MLKALKVFRVIKDIREYKVLKDSKAFKVLLVQLLDQILKLYLTIIVYLVQHLI